MTGCINSVELALAKGVWDDLGSPTAVSISSISGKLTSQFIGRLNTSLYSCFSIESGAYFGNGLATDYRALDIYGELYKIDYYTRQINAVLSNPNLMITKIADGDAIISRDSPAKLAQLYATLIKDSNARLSVLMERYTKSQSLAGSSDYYMIQQYGPGVGGPFGFPGYAYGASRQ